MGVGRYSAAWLACGLMTACAADASLPLLDVDAISPLRVEPGETFHVIGAGFAPGRSAHVRFSGELRAPGSQPRRVSVDAVGLAFSASRIDVEYDDRLRSAFGEGGTFIGAVGVEIAGAEPGSSVGGRLESVRVELVRGTRARLDAEMSAQAQAARTMAALGIVPEEVADLGQGGAAAPGSGVEGVRVRSVRPSSVAARGGLRAGDTIVAVDGASVEGPSQLLVAPGATRIDLRVERAAEAAPIDLRISAAPALERTWTHRLAVPFAAVLLFVYALLALSPIAHRISRSSSEPDGIAREAGRHEGGGNTAALGLAAVLLLVFVTLTLRVGRLDALELVLAGFGVRGAWSLFARAAEGRWSAREWAARFVPDLVLVLVAVAAAVAVGDLALTSLIGVQAAGPWTWFGLSSPAGVCALLLLLRHGFRAPPRRVGEGEATARPRSDRAARFVDAVAQELGLLWPAVIGGAVLLGGWAMPHGFGLGAADPFVRGGVGAIAYAIKVWVLMHVGGRLTSRREAPTLARTAIELVLFGGLAICLAWSWRLSELEGIAETALGVAVSVSCLFIMARVGRRMTQPAPRFDPMY